MPHHARPEVVQSAALWYLRERQEPLLGPVSTYRNTTREDESMNRLPTVLVLVAMAAMAITAATAPYSARAEIVDAIWASVDTEVILRSEIITEIGANLIELQRTAASAEAFDRQAQELISATLEQAIEGKILLREAQLFGIDVPDEEVEAHIDVFRKLYPSNEDFLQELAKAGETLSDFRTRSWKQLMAQRLARSKLNSLRSEVVVSETDVSQYYEDHEEQFMRPERVLVRQVFLRAGTDPAERAQARARLQTILEDLEAGADFNEVAQMHSQAPGAEEGGLVGWQQRGDLVKNLEEAVFALPEGGVTGILESPGGVHVMKADRREEAGLASLDEVRAEVEPLLRNRAAEERYRKWIEELRKRSRVRTFL